MKFFHSMGHVIGGALLIAGTTIGVGMLALPVETGPAGFIPSVLGFTLCWALLMSTGLLTAELSLWMPKDTSFISMAEKFLGPWGKYVFWIMYLFLFFTVMVAHISGGGSILKHIMGLGTTDKTASILYAALFTPVVYLGTRFVDRLNMLLISGVVLCYIAFISVSIRSVDLTLLTYTDWSGSWISLPILFTSFTFHIIIPTLVTYMDRHAAKIRLAIILGASIPFIVYLVWEFLILGIVPVTGADGLMAARSLGQNAVIPLRNHVNEPLIYDIGKYFAFFAMTTSFIPLALSFFDFLADGFRWKKKGSSRIILCALVFGSPMLVALLYPKIFLVALNLAGGISCAFLFGIMPPLMVWVGRYFKRLPLQRGRLFGGRPLLFGFMAFSFLILITQISYFFN